MLITIKRDKLSEKEFVSEPFLILDAIKENVDA